MPQKNQPLSLRRINFFVKAFTFVKLPLLFFISPKILEVGAGRSVVRVNLGFRTRNHLNVMYFGALSMGAELSIAVQAVLSIQNSRQKIDFLFKNFQCDFLKRADNDVLFICDEARRVHELIEESSRSPDRIEKTFSGYARTIKSEEPVMKYQLTLSVKNRSKAT